MIQLAAGTPSQAGLAGWKCQCCINPPSREFSGSVPRSFMQQTEFRVQAYAAGPGAAQAAIVAK